MPIAHLWFVDTCRHAEAALVRLMSRQEWLVSESAWRLWKEKVGEQGGGGGGEEGGEEWFTRRDHD